MNRGVAKIRGVIAIASLATPYLLLFAAGSVWLYQNHLLLAWAGFSLAFTLAGWYLLRGFWRKAEPPEVQEDPSWPPQGMEVWKQVEFLADEVESEDLPFDQPEKVVALVRRVVDVVARHYHPHAKAPWLETPFPHVLRIVELVARDPPPGHHELSARFTYPYHRRLTAIAKAGGHGPTILFLVSNWFVSGQYSSGLSPRRPRHDV